ncbi:RluA family pseudouridine synthase [Nesterenkonia jeotgali]|uniref:Pseudouridine synthase n=1 Tax=Nesterenkonia jeotgali TaxID=317018 RepID=A0A0W8IGG1_9MICC|nr:RluA family pseudouridine synthase [Nesterenkonia jeotgali]KUG59050.1 RNA pseudouridine synthase [Nesterenkonia jeotgali]MBA8921125.1 23S rRNA pseudouridine1911/1915/1917 synthase [Nesterenkonia jeotgali]
MSAQQIAVPEALDGGRADVVLAALFQVPRIQATQWLKEGLVTWAQDRTQGRTAGRAVKKSDRLAAGAQLAVVVPEKQDPLQVRIEAVEEMTVLHQDEAIVVVDKPVGVAAHPSPGWTGPTVIGGLLAAGVEISTSGAQERRGIVHRLDVGTSGVMVVAKTEHAYTMLKDAFRQRTTQKSYHALVQGLPDPVDGTIDAPIGRHPGHDWRFAVLEGGRESRTHYRLQQAYGRASLMDINLETGRTHQIRVHFSALGHPCAGDLTYGADPQLAADLGLTRQWLHAVELGFHHPDHGEWVSYRTDYPADLAQALEILENG